MIVMQFPINERLVWDYDLPANAEEDEAFRRWYLARVLTRGTSSDLRAIGLPTIYAYLPVLQLPANIRAFWDWYFDLPHAKSRYGHINRLSEEAAAANRG